MTKLNGLLLGGLLLALTGCQNDRFEDLENEVAMQQLIDTHQHNEIANLNAQLEATQADLLAAENALAAAIADNGTSIALNAANIQDNVTTIATNYDILVAADSINLDETTIAINKLGTDLSIRIEDEVATLNVQLDILKNELSIAIIDGDQYVINNLTQHITNVETQLIQAVSNAPSFDASSINSAITGLVQADITLAAGVASNNAAILSLTALSANYEPTNGVLTITYADGSSYSTEDLRGSNGANGTQGAQGIQGLQGVPGANGSTGNTGVAGAQGIQGIQGVQGEQGIQGVQGVQGNTVTGTTGLQGVQGFQGVQGEQGEEGIQGIQGNAGVAGNDGVDGAQGVAGNDGTSSNLVITTERNATDTGHIVTITINGIVTNVFEVLDGEDGEDGVDGMDAALPLTTPVAADFTNTNFELIRVSTRTSSWKWTSPIANVVKPGRVENTFKMIHRLGDNVDTSNITVVFTLHQNADHDEVLTDNGDGYVWTHDTDSPTDFLLDRNQTHVGITAFSVDYTDGVGNLVGQGTNGDNIPANGDSVSYIIYLDGVEALSVSNVNVAVNLTLYNVEDFNTL